MFNKTVNIIISALFLLTSFVTSAKAEDDLVGEYLVKAAFLYNFAKFVEWPDDTFATSSSHIRLCILGDNPFGAAIESIQGKTVRGRELVIKFISRVESLEGCHILFISASKKDKLDQIFHYTKHCTVLTVGDITHFTHRGGIISLFKSGTKIKFEINIDAAKASELKISSKLLKLAKIVRNPPQKERPGSGS